MNDLEAFARLVQALAPWRQQVKYVSLLRYGQAGADDTRFAFNVCPVAWVAVEIRCHRPL